MTNTIPWIGVLVQEKIKTGSNDLSSYEKRMFIIDKYRDTKYLCVDCKPKIQEEIQDIIKRMKYVGNKRTVIKGSKIKDFTILEDYGEIELPIDVPGKHYKFDDIILDEAIKRGGNAVFKYHFNWKERKKVILFGRAVLIKKKEKEIKKENIFIVVDSDIWEFHGSELTNKLKKPFIVLTPPGIVTRIDYLKDSHKKEHQEKARKITGMWEYMSRDENYDIRIPIETWPSNLLEENGSSSFKGDTEILKIVNWYAHHKSPIFLISNDNNILFRCRELKRHEKYDTLNCGRYEDFLLYQKNKGLFT